MLMVEWIDTDGVDGTCRRHRRTPALRQFTGGDASWPATLVLSSVEGRAPDRLRLEKEG